MKKSMKIITLALIVVMAIMLGTSVLATGVDLDPSTIVANTSGDGGDKMQAIGATILGYVRIIGSILAVVILAIIGLKYMMGSAEEKAEYKKSMMPYLIGAILVFASSQLASAIYNAANSMNA